MPVMTFDTLKFATRLEDAGVPSAQAKAEAEVLREVFDERDRALTALENKVNSQQMLARHEAEHAATKNDLSEAKSELKDDMQAQKAELKDEIHKLDAKIELLRKDMVLLRWMFGILITAVLSLVIKAFFTL